MNEEKMENRYGRFSKECLELIARLIPVIQEKDDDPRVALAVFHGICICLAQTLNMSKEDALKFYMESWDVFRDE